jgi:HEAT repeat protein
MRRSRRLLLVLLLAGACGLVVLLVRNRGRGSTAYWIEQLRGPDAAMRVKAVRTLPERKGDAAQVIPALTEALKDEDPEVRRGAAYGLGTFGEEAGDAVPALQTSLHDPDPGVRKAAGIALTYIDPTAAPKTAPSGRR